MEIASLKLVCFSPTGTTRAIVQGIAGGINAGRVQVVDLTLPDARRHRLHASPNDLVIVGVPVYMGRVPAVLSEWLCSMEARSTPAVCVVVYGNRAFDDALLELRDILKSRGCIPIAGAAFIGEHSFSSPGTPTAEGRPDASDISLAGDFGRKVLEKLLSISGVDEVPELDVPGDYPYGGVTDLWSVDFIQISDECTECGICAAGCPVGAIDSENLRSIDRERCFTCCACIKNCPEGARTMKAGPVRDAALRLHELYREPKEPAFFF